MKNGKFENPGKDNSDEVPVFSDWDLKDPPRVEEEYSGGGETPTKVDSSPQVLGSLRRQSRSRRSRRLVVLFGLGLAILVLAIFFIMRPEVKEPEIAGTQIRSPATSIEPGEKPAPPAAVEKKVREQQPSEGGILEEEKPAAPKPAEILLVGRGTGEEEKVVSIEGLETPKGERGDSITEPGGKRADIQDRGGEKSQIAKAAESTGQAIPEQKPPLGRFTINVGSFRERVRAERLMNELNEKGYNAFVAEATLPGSGTWYRVSVGRFPSRQDAQARARELKEKEGMDFFVRKLKAAKS